MSMDDRFRITICDGHKVGYSAVTDDLNGSIMLAELAHEAGYAVWVWDAMDEVPVAVSTAGCFCCSREHECDDHLDLAPDDAAAAFFVRFLTRNDYPACEIRVE